MHMTSETVSKHLERKTIYYGGIGVTVEIDYEKGTISLLDAVGKPKQWVFAYRQIEYMAGWQNILDAMKHAIEVCEKDLHKQQEAREKVLARKEMDLMRALAVVKPFRKEEK